MIERGKKKHYKFTIFLMALLLLVGGTLIAAVIYLAATGMLDAMLRQLETELKNGGIYSILAVFWIVLIPILLLVLLVINLKRRKKFREFEDAWKTAAELAGQREAERRAAEEAAREALPDPRFSVLHTLDAGKRVRYTNRGEMVCTLRDLCERFRLFAAARMGLYYDISVIREFVAGLAVSHILILQGMSGTGKTSLAYAFGEFLGNPSVIVPVQPMWKERTDLLGYYNEFTQKYNETLLLQKMYEANGREGMYIVVLDEMNIARVEYYFAEFLSLLEIPDTETRYLDVVPDQWKNDPVGLRDGRIKLPSNMWFIGTANNDDSTFAISDKVYDRAMVLDFHMKAERFSIEDAADDRKTVSLTAAQFQELVEKEQEWFEITKRNEFRLRTLDEYLIEKFQISFGNRIMRQIRSYISVYVACGGEELDALDDILSKKVFRKLASINNAYVRTEADALCEFMDRLFGEDRMPKCKETVRIVVRNG